jgi:hypothetical protein
VADGALVDGRLVSAVISPGPGSPALVSGWAGREPDAQRKASAAASNVDRHEFPPHKDVKNGIT